MGKLHAVSLTRLPDGKYPDGDGLYFFVRGASRTWFYRYTDDQRCRRTMGLGSLSEVGLKEARALVANLKIQSADPIADRREKRIKARVPKKPNFEICATNYIETNKSGWSNPKHAAQWTSTLKNYAYPTLGHLPIDEIAVSHIYETLKPIWATKNETARRVRGRGDSVLSFATVHGYRLGANPAGWRGNLDHLLPAASKVNKVKHHASLDYRQIGTFMTQLRAMKGIGARCLEFAILTACRSNEARYALWSEIDLIAKVWTIPPQKMKGRKEHRVPLSDATITLLKGLRKVEDCPYVFPSTKLGSLSDMTLTATCRRITTGVTVHGFRSSFRTWAIECISDSYEAAEMCLAHTVGNSVERAYMRSDLWNKRTNLLAEWAHYCSLTPASS